ncbi:TRI14-like protein [Metarhizium guizhouense ARSEF 977]|uniref:TRI14-like protein n=1 Tax=Metarhizium guizhouense (strain ARSEF 977) TaxID=1276136 RepID=A0A0B4GM32_METGA|nr:TRI14-like protein [Metarhizium guizhouense ARSEF 977]
MRSNTLLPSLAVLGAGAFAGPTKGGDVTIKSFQLYPENADYYPELDRVYISVLYNSSVAVWDPTNNVMEDPITFPETMNKDYHASGIEVEAETGLLSAIINPGAAFDTSGADISGDSFLYKIDMKTKKVVWRSNVSTPTKGAYGGCQEAIHDRHHNTFVLCTYPGAIIKVSADGKTATPWYLSNYMEPGATVQRPGLTGGVSKDDFLLAVDDETHKLMRFDMREEKGNPVVVPIGKNNEDVGLGLDGAYLPPKYDGRVLLVTSESKEINVIVSNNNWQTAEKVGVVPNTYFANPENNRGFSVSTVQIPVRHEERIYSINEYFLDAQDASKPTVPDTLAKDRSEFPLQDITKAVDDFLW